MENMKNMENSMRTVSEQDLQLGKWLASAAMGALVMYMLDPERGPGRRAASAARLRSLGKQTGQALDSAVQAVRQRAASILPDADSAQSARGDGAVPPDSGTSSRDATAAARASSQPGTASTHPGTLDGLGAGIGAAPRDWRERSGAPTLRNAALWGGGALGLVSLARRSAPLGMLAGLAGAAMLVRRLRGRSLPSLGVNAGKAVTVEKSLRIEASPEQVYDLWANYENFPRFMHNVVEVRDLGGIRSHWVVKGPAGAQCEFDAILTERSRPDRLAWQSAPGSEIEQDGEVRIDEVRGGTRATVRLSYRPPAGAVGERFAELMGSDPQRRLEEDLRRMKSLLERGRIPDAAARDQPANSKFLH